MKPSSASLCFLRISAPAFIVIAAASIVGCGHKSKHHDAPVAEPSATFTFLSDPGTSYERVDRVGMPAVNTAVITSKNEYNLANPSNDAAGQFVPQIQSNVAAVHSKLDDDLVAAALTPASTSTSLAQAGPLIIPDTLKIDTTVVAGFPNGRKLPDQVIDITLAVILLDLGAASQTPRTLANLPLNPPANDKAFSTTFPYLAAPF